MNLTRILAKIQLSSSHQCCWSCRVETETRNAFVSGFSFLLNQQKEAFEEAFREAAIGLVLAPLDDRMKIRLIELDCVIKDSTVTKHLIQRVRQLRECDQNINHYLDSLVSDFVAGTDVE